MNLFFSRINLLLAGSSNFRTKKSNLHYSFVRWHQHLQITLRAIEQLKKIAEPGEYLRINVDSGGCAGFEYKILLDKRFNKDEDEIIEKDGVKIVVDKISLNFIKGSKLDFTQELMRSAFRITDNPLSTQGCSCGSSFAPKFMST